MLSSDFYTIGTGHAAPSIIGRHLAVIPIENPLDTMTVGWIKMAGEPLSEEPSHYITILTDLLRGRENKE
uniref:hypothetical protein n=1 Tax=Megasphaera elsdenii TaxID=907 RepID=UPI003FEF9780